MIHFFTFCLKMFSTTQYYRYFSGWELMPPKIRKSLLIILCRTLKPRKLTAGKMFIPSMHTFGKVSLKFYTNRHQRICIIIKMKFFLANENLHVYICCFCNHRSKILIRHKKIQLNTSLKL